MNTTKFLITSERNEARQIANGLKPKYEELERKSMQDLMQYTKENKNEKNYHKTLKKLFEIHNAYYVLNNACWKLKFNNTRRGRNFCYDITEAIETLIKYEAKVY